MVNQGFQRFPLFPESPEGNRGFSAMTGTGGARDAATVDFTHRELFPLFPLFPSPTFHPRRETSAILRRSIPPREVKANLLCPNSACLNHCKRAVPGRYQLLRLGNHHVIRLVETVDRRGVHRDLTSAPPRLSPNRSLQWMRKPTEGGGLTLRPPDEWQGGRLGSLAPLFFKKGKSHLP